MNDSLSQENIEIPYKAGVHYWGRTDVEEMDNIVKGLIETNKIGSNGNTIILGEEGNFEVGILELPDNDEELPKEIDDFTGLLADLETSDNAYPTVVFNGEQRYGIWAKAASSEFIEETKTFNFKKFPYINGIEGIYCVENMASYNKSHEERHAFKQLKEYLEKNKNNIDIENSTMTVELTIRHGPVFTVRYDGGISVSRNILSDGTVAELAEEFEGPLDNENITSIITKAGKKYKEDLREASDEKAELVFTPIPLDKIEEAHNENPHYGLVEIAVYKNVSAVKSVKISVSEDREEYMSLSHPDYSGSTKGFDFDPNSSLRGFNPDVRSFGVEKSYSTGKTEERNIEPVEIKVNVALRTDKKPSYAARIRLTAQN